MSLKSYLIGSHGVPEGFTEEEWTFYLLTRDVGRLDIERASATLFRVRDNRFPYVSYCTEEEVLSILRALPDRRPMGGVAASVLREDIHNRPPPPDLTDLLKDI